VCALVTNWLVCTGCSCADSSFVVKLLLPTECTFKLAGRTGYNHLVGRTNLFIRPPSLHSIPVYNLDPMHGNSMYDYHQFVGILNKHSTRSNTNYTPDFWSMLNNVRCIHSVGHYYNTFHNCPHAHACTHRTHARPHSFVHFTWLRPSHALLCRHCPLREDMCSN
jgi:hypothetical protein